MERNGTNRSGDLVPVEANVPAGIKVPVGDLKDTIEKTVNYVVKNGDSFETRLKTNESSKNKFAFIFNNDEYYDYYQWRLGRYSGGGDDGKSSSTSTRTRTDGTNDTNPPTLFEPIPTPQELTFLTSLPHITLYDLKVLKLTALFTARNGDAYLNQLHQHQIQRGHKAQFQFIEKSHSLHELFNQYVNQYKQVITILTSDNKADMFPELLEDAYTRAKYTKQNKVKQHNEANELKQRQLNYASIDWQDFSVIGKIEFDDIDKVTELAVPLNRQDLIYRSLEAKTRDIELEVGKLDKDNRPEPQPESQPESQPEPQPESQPEQEASPQPPNVPKGMKIKAAGESRLKKRSRESNIKCPITGKLIPELKFDEHIRILLRDPHYEQEKQNYITKNFKYSSNLTNDEVYDNIKRLTKRVKLDKGK